MQKSLKVLCLHWKTTVFCLEHGYYHAVNMGSGCVGIFFQKTRRGSFLFAYEAKSYPNYASEACHILKISYNSTVKSFEKSLIK